MAGLNRATLESTFNRLVFEHNTAWVNSLNPEHPDYNPVLRLSDQNERAKHGDTHADMEGAYQNYLLSDAGCDCGEQPDDQ